MKVDVGSTGGVTRQHKALLECVAQELHTQAFDALADVEQQAIHEDAEEQCLSCAFLRQSRTQHGNLKVDLQNDFTTGNNHYPKNHQQTLHLLDKHSKTVVTKLTQSEGTLFAQRGGRGGGKGKGADRKAPYDEKCWEHKECYKCHKKGHPASHCPGLDDDNDASCSSTVHSVKKLAKDLNSMKKLSPQSRTPSFNS